MSTDLVLVAEASRATGTRASRRMRREGTIPATVYGLGRAPLSVSVPWRELRRILTTDAGVNALVSLDVAGRREPTLVKQIQRHPTRRDVIHVDFLRVDLNVKLDVEVAIELVGEADEVLKRQGVVEQLMYSMVLSTKPGDIPNSIELDVTGLTLDSPLRVRDLRLPPGVTTDVDGEEVIVQGALSAAAMSTGQSGEPAPAEAPSGS